MSKSILAMFALLLSNQAFADSSNQRTAKEMVAVLQSEKVQSLMSQESGLGRFKGIKYLFSYRTAIGPAIYELSFESNAGATPQLCTVPVQVNVQTAEVIEVDSPACKELK